ncbi:hypothetical protein MF1_08840 [Bartonella quintana]|nr:hypothetical protein MF1_08840 [Bartonella quintana]
MNNYATLSDSFSHKFIKDTLSLSHTTHSVSQIFSFNEENDGYGTIYLAYHNSPTTKIFQNSYVFFAIADCAAAKRAIGTRKGEQET